MTRKLLTLVVALAATLLFAGASHAAAFVSGAYTLKIGGLPGISLASTGSGVSNPSGMRIQLSPGAFGPEVVDLPDSLFTAVPQISDLRIGKGTGMVANMMPDALGVPAVAGTFTFGAKGTNGAGPDFGGGFGGQVPLLGTATICVFACPAIAIQVPLSQGGVGGTTARLALGQAVFVRNAPWTVGTVTVTVKSVTTMAPGGTTNFFTRGGTAPTAGGGTQMLAPRRVDGFGLSHTANSVTDAGTVLPLKVGPQALTTAEPVTLMFGPNVITLTTRTVTLMGSDNRTADGGGTVTLVSPSRADTSTALANSLAIFSVLTLTFIPEPGTLLLLGSGVLGLAAIGRRRGNRS